MANRSSRDAAANQNSSREDHIVRGKAHPSVVKPGNHVITDPGLKLASLDVLTRDISILFSKSGRIGNEINTTLDLQHHILAAEKEQLVPVTAIIVEYILSHGASIRTEQPNRVGQL